MAFRLWPTSSAKKDKAVETKEESKQPENTTIPSDSSAATSAQDEVSKPSESYSPESGVADTNPAAAVSTKEEPRPATPTSASPPLSASEPQPAPTVVTSPSVSAPANDVVSTPAAEHVTRPRPEKRFSWRSIVRPRTAHDRKASLPLREELVKEASARQEYVERQIHRTRSDKRALKSALVLRELIVGPFAVPSVAPPKKSKVLASSVTSTSAQKVKAQLLRPKTAKKVIAQLRQLPSSDVPVVGKTSAGEEFKYLSSGPIHAVCLACSDPEATEKHFAHLDKVEAFVPSSNNLSPKPRELTFDLSQAVGGITSVTATSFEKLKVMLSELDVVSLITVPDWGLGQPADAPGILSGAVPTAKAILQGVEQVTPQLMALGYATGKSLLPSHAGVYPPTDRMSVITYWWGLEVVIPEPSVQYLSNVPSVAHTVVNFLTALSVANGGVRELLPFVRYISTYIDAEFNAIRDQDQGQGVVCAATWLMPAALVPRPWDFPQPPPVGTAPPGGDKDASAPSVPGAILMPPPVPNPNTSPVFVAPANAPIVQSQGEKTAKADEDIPEVTVTPPTPKGSDTLGTANGSEIAATVANAQESSDSPAAPTISKPGVNGAPVKSDGKLVDKPDESGDAATCKASEGRVGSPAGILLT